MNVRCDSCGTVYRVDPAKVPARGVQARCAVCPNIISVAAESAPVSATKPPAPTPARQEEAAPTASRPSAPVFTPTPGTPRRQPPPMAQPQPAAPVTATAPRSAAPASPVAPTAPTAPTAAPKAPVNPFLQRDPQQKARRLARALVSDMIVYQPDKRQKSLDSGTLKEDFEEEIKKSWEEYVGQIGDDVANSSDHFKEALNDILAGGQPLF